ncbi:Phosphoribosylaminoimidazole-succinocarboxamide synthase, partial [Teratosphaeria destructans]
MASPNVVTTIDLKQHGFKHIASGKVREIFEVNPDILLFIATDRISAYDVILANASPPSPLTHPNNHNTNPPQGIPEKGAILTQLSIYWFDLITTHLPTLRTHLHSPTLPPNIPPSLHPLLTNRTMQVQRLAILPLESIVRGYLTGSAWSEYRTHGTVHGLPLPPGLKESQRLPAPLWTPSTKA